MIASFALGRCFKHAKRSCYLSLSEGKYAIALEHSTCCALTCYITRLYVSTIGCLGVLAISSARNCSANTAIFTVAHMMQSGSTRPERIPSTLAGLQELHRNTLQGLQQQLQAHLTAAHQELRAQVMLSLAGLWGWGSGRAGGAVWCNCHYNCKNLKDQ